MDHDGQAALERPFLLVFPRGEAYTEATQTTDLSMGNSVNIREGSVRWPVLRQALEVVNYNGWMTIESNGSIPLEERNRRLDLILSGK